MPDRPDPDALLRHLSEAEQRASRARFKVFFGAAPGVGKTFAMLQEAHRRKADGVDVVVGVVETHGRPETMALVSSLQVLPRRACIHRGVSLEEFDLEAALVRRPRMILMDELAHTNAPGCLHGKRWQDVLALLDAGIDVFSTLNVQHLESLREVVAQITGIRVQERVPDTVLERTDELELVDISVEDLLARLAEGKIYMPEAARHATERFFRRGNLLALRELALRRTAELVDADMRRYREAEGIQATWAAGQRLMVGITPQGSSEPLIRETRRLAEALGASWMAVYVEAGRPLSLPDRERLDAHLRLVERLGGEALVLQGSVSVGADLLALARSRNVTQILLGRPRRRWRLWMGVQQEVERNLEGIHLHVIPVEDAQISIPIARPLPSPWPTQGVLGLCTLYVAFATAVAYVLHPPLDLADIVMVFTMPILLAATRHGRNAALVTSGLAVLAYNFFFIPPQYTLAVRDLRHTGTFLIMLVLGWVIGNLTERIRQAALHAQRREQRTLALHSLGEALVQAGDQAGTITRAAQAVQAQFQSRVSFFLPDPQGRLAPMETWNLDERQRGVAQWAYDHGQAAGRGTEVLPASEALFLPLRGHRGILGVMALRSDDVPLWEEPDQRHLLESFANQTALALERAQLSAEAHASRLHVEREQLRNTLLSSVSHDLRTPLASITGAVTTLLEDPTALSASERTSLLGAIRDEAFRMHRLVSNLLDLTRIESGTLPIRREWIPAEEVVGSALAHLGGVAEDRAIEVQLDHPSTLLQGDSVLLEQLLINLVENALKFSPMDRPVEVQVHGTGQGTTLLVSDHGPGIPEGFEARIFEKLFRLPGHRQGAGLGLAICQGIVHAHGGSIQATNRPEGGARFIVSLPFSGEPPTEPAEEVEFES